MYLFLESQTFLEFRVKFEAPVNFERSASSFASLCIPWLNFIVSSFRQENIRKKTLNGV